MICFLIYVIGYILAYILFKKEWVDSFDEWLVEDRRFALFISLASWVTAMIAIVILLCKYFNKKSGSKPAKW